MLREALTVLFVLDIALLGLVLYHFAYRDSHAYLLILITLAIGAVAVLPQWILSTRDARRYATAVFMAGVVAHGFVLGLLYSHFGRASFQWVFDLLLVFALAAAALVGWLNEE